MRITIVDAFTDVPFAGNPAAVCRMDAAGDPEWMQSVAAEMNLSETAFLSPEGDGYRLRWFTPKAEVDLCGHATVASAHALAEDGLLGPTETVRFETKSGTLTATRRGEWIDLDFPQKPESPAEAPEGFAAALGAEPTYVGRNAFDYLALLPDEAAVRSLHPDFGALRRLPVRGVIVTALSDDSRFDFVSRFFAPAVGVDEDPVTGSAHCCLGPFWGTRLGKTLMTGRQLSARGGTVGLRLDGDRIRLTGSAVTILKGEFLATTRGKGRER